MVKVEASSIKSHTREIGESNGRDDMGTKTHRGGAVDGVCNVVVAEDEELDTVGSANPAARMGDAVVAATSSQK